MNTTQVFEEKAAGANTHFLDAPYAASAELERRENTRAIFRKKYDTMLNMAELIVSLQMSVVTDQKQVKTMDELKSLIAQTRKRLQA